MKVIDLLNALNRLMVEHGPDLPVEVIASYDSGYCFGINAVSRVRYAPKRESVNGAPSPVIYIEADEEL